MTLTAQVDSLRRADRQLNSANPTPFPVPVAGIEAVVVGSVSALRRSDWVLPGLRERIGAVLRGAPVERLQHASAGARPYKVVPATASPANRALYAVGLAVGSGTTALVHLGIGSASDGSLHEALNLAALHHASVLFVVAVHPLAGDAPLGRQLAADLGALATAFSLPHTKVDGTDVNAVHSAVLAARDAGGPHLIEATLESPE